eukprot:gene6820-13817_t
MFHSSVSHSHKNYFSKAVCTPKDFGMIPYIIICGILMHPVPSTLPPSTLMSFNASQSHKNSLSTNVLESSSTNEYFWRLIYPIRTSDLQEVSEYSNLNLENKHTNILHRNDIDRGSLSPNHSVSHSSTNISGPSPFWLYKLLSSSLFPPRITRLFHSYSFKGYTFAMVKPLLSLQSFSMGVRIPITANYPEYDRRGSLPRIGTFLEVAYPLDFVWTISVSFPVSSVINGASKVGQLCGLVSPTLGRRIRKKSKPSISVRRVGGTLGLRLNLKEGLRPYCGPWMLYVTNRRLPSRAVSSATYLPAALVSLLNTMIMAMTTRVRHPPSSTETSIASSPTLSPSVPGVQLKDLLFWQSLLIQWLALKTAGLGVNLSLNFSKAGCNVRSNALLDIYPFYPTLFSVVMNSFANAIRQLLRSLDYFCHRVFLSIRNEPLVNATTSTTAAGGAGEIYLNQSDNNTTFVLTPFDRNNIGIRTALDGLVRSGTGTGLGLGLTSQIQTELCNAG